MSHTAKHVIFSGRVQGVGFRFTAHSTANQYGLVGFVRNLPDETVEMVVQGDSEAIESCIRDLEKSFEDYVRETSVEEIAIDPRRREFRITF